MSVNRWASADHVQEYLGIADSVPHRAEGEAALLEFLPFRAQRILDLGTGDGRLLRLVKQRYPRAESIGIDFSPAMLERARQQFAQDGSTSIVTHDLDHSLPDLGKFDVIVSSFAIHHLVHQRKRSLYAEVRQMLSVEGVFCNLEHVSSPTAQLHEEFLGFLGLTPEKEDPSNRLLDVQSQLQWLREIGFTDVDCLWKWRELALLAGRNPTVEA